MEIITQPHIIEPGSVVAAIGMFDGVHRGHSMLIDYLNSQAHDRGLKSAAITFREHPQKVLRSDTDLRMIMTLDDRIATLGSHGVDYVILMDFNLQLASLDSYDYIKLIRDSYGVKVLVTGFNHRFGHNRQEGFDDYKRHGIDLGVELLQACEYHGPYSPVSSSIIRRLIMAGKVDNAAQCLGRLFVLHGKVEHGFEIGRKLGFPTANIGDIDPSMVIPHRGAYVVKVCFADGSLHGGMANIGVRPTVGNGEHRQSIEVHIFDFNGDLYGMPVTIEFVGFLRAELKLDSLDELRLQLENDKVRALQMLEQSE